MLWLAGLVLAAECGTVLYNGICVPAEWAGAGIVFPKHCSVIQARSSRWCGSCDLLARLIFIYAYPRERSHRLASFVDSSLMMIDFYCDHHHNPLDLDQAQSEPEDPSYLQKNCGAPGEAGCRPTRINITTGTCRL